MFSTSRSTFSRLSQSYRYYPLVPWKGYQHQSRTFFNATNGLNRLGIKTFKTVTKVAIPALPMVALGAGVYCSRHQQHALNAAVEALNSRYRNVMQLLEELPALKEQDKLYLMAGMSSIDDAQSAYLEQARQLANEAIPLMGEDSANARLFKGIVLMRQGKNEPEVMKQALAEFEKMLKLDKYRYHPSLLRRRAKALDALVLQL